MGKELEVAQVWEYPVKSMAGSKRKSLEITNEGLINDRRWMVVHKNGEMLTPRNVAEIVLMFPELREDSLVINKKDESSVLEVPLKAEGERIEVVVWGNKLQGIDLGQIPAEWLSDGLGVECRLVYMPDDYDRIKHGQRFNFADSYPLTTGLIESFEDLLNRLHKAGETSITLEDLVKRFRPNIIFKGGEKYDDDTWQELVTETGQAIHIIKDCVRCPVPQVDPNTAVKGKQPTKELLSYRRVTKTDVIFCQKAVAEPGIIYPGQTVTISARKNPPKFI